MNRIQKGKRGYLQSQRRILTVRTAILFALSLAIYLLGWWSTGSNKNLLTIVAVLGCLPASRSAVNAVMFYRYHGIGEQDAGKIALHEGGLCALYDLVFTSYDKNFEIHHMTVTDRGLTGYTASPACDAKACEKHLKAMCSQNGIRDVDIRIFRELPKYLNRLDALQGEAEAVSGTAERAAEKVAGEKPTKNTAAETAAKNTATETAAAGKAGEKQERLVSLLCAISL